MNTIVIYNSQTGFTKQYAMWLSEQVKATCIPFEQVKKQDFSKYDAIVFGSWCSAGMIQKLKWFKEHQTEWSGKKLAVFAVGASPIENPDVDTALHQNFTEEEWQRICITYCPGGLSYDKMSFGSKTMMKLFAKMMASKKDKTEGEAAMASMIGQSYDISNPKYLEPILTYLQDTSC